MEISPRAHLVNANKGLEAAAPVIVADYLRGLISAAEAFGDDIDIEYLAACAYGLDPR